MMKKLIAKIRETVGRKDAQTKCALLAQVYEQVNASLERLGGGLGVVDLSADMLVLDVGLKVDVVAFNSKLDDLEAICDELVKILNPELQKLIKILKPRFEAHMYRHKNISWAQVEKRLCEADPKKIWSLNEMERTHGEPDVVGVDKKTGELIFQDRSAESPTGRRNCVYDKDAEEQLKRKYPDGTCNGNAIDMAAQMGLELLDEAEYREAQKVDKLDQNSWSWLKTPIDIRRRGVALSGRRDEDGVRVNENHPRNRDNTDGFRASLRV